MDMWLDYLLVCVGGAVHKRAQTERNLAHKSEHEPFCPFNPPSTVTVVLRMLTGALLTQWKLTQRIPICWLSNGKALTSQHTRSF